MKIHGKLKRHYSLIFVSCFIATYTSGPSIQSMPLPQWLMSGFVFSMISIFPLLFFIPTVRAPTARNLSWFGFFLLAYLVWGIMRMFSPNGFIGGLLICTFVMSTFFYTVLWLRPLKQEAKRLKKEAEQQ